MARTGAVIAGLEKIGIRGTRSDRIMRCEREAGLLPMGAQGTKSSIGHLEAPHLKNVILGFAGDQPSDAAEAVLRLGELEFIGDLKSENGNKPLSPRVNGCLSKVLEQIIEGIANRIVENRDPDPDAPNLFLPDLILSVNPPHAEIHWSNYNREVRHIDVYRPALGVSYVIYPTIVTKQTRIQPEMLVAMGELLADTIQQQRDVPENTKAAGAPPPSGLRAKSKQAAKPVPVDKEQLTHTPESEQSRRVRGLPSSPLAER